MSWYINIHCSANNFISTQYSLDYILACLDRWRFNECIQVDEVPAVRWQCLQSNRKVTHYKLAEFMHTSTSTKNSNRGCARRKIAKANRWQTYRKFKQQLIGVRLTKTTKLYNYITRNAAIVMCRVQLNVKTW